MLQRAYIFLNFGFTESTTENMKRITHTRCKRARVVERACECFVLVILLKYVRERYKRNKDKSSLQTRDL